VFSVDILQCPNGGRNTSKHLLFYLQTVTMLLFLLIWYLIVIQSHQHKDEHLRVHHVEESKQLNWQVHFSITRMTKKGIIIFFASGGEKMLAVNLLFLIHPIHVLDYTVIVQLQF
jgi:hypothetical protein